MYHTAWHTMDTKKQKVVILALKGHFSHFSSLMLTHEGQAAQLPPHVEEKLQDVYFYKVFKNGTNRAST